MEASLGMYDFEELQRHNDVLFEAVAKECLALGINHDMIPQALTRGGQRSTDELSLCGSLFLSQTCGLPLSCSSPGTYQVVGSPIYGHSQNKESRAEYCSVIICKESSIITKLADLRGKTVAVNQRISLSGSLLFAATLGYDLMASVDILPTGGHVKSIESVQQGRALAACIDIVTFELLQLHRPHLVAGLRVICHTEKAPSLPFITGGTGGQNSTPDFVHILRLSLHRVVMSSDESVIQSRNALLLINFDFGEGFTATTCAFSSRSSESDLSGKYITRVLELQTKAQLGLEKNMETQRLAYLNCSQFETKNITASLLRPLLPDDCAMIETLLSWLQLELEMESGNNKGIFVSNRSLWGTCGSGRIAHVVIPHNIGAEGTRGGERKAIEKLKHLLISGVDESLEIEVVYQVGTRLRVCDCPPSDHEIVRSYKEAERTLIENLDSEAIFACVTGEVEPGGDIATLILLKRGGKVNTHTETAYLPPPEISSTYFKDVRIHLGTVNTEDMAVCVASSHFIRYFNTSDGMKEVKTDVVWGNEFAYIAQKKLEENAADSSSGGGNGGRRSGRGGGREELVSSDGYSSSESHALGGAVEAELDMYSCPNRLRLPEGYSYIDEDVVFDPSLHLDLASKPHGPPSTLTQLGYSQEQVTADLPCSFGQSRSFQILTPIALALLRKSLAQLDIFAQSSPRIPKVLRGGAFRSKFIRDLSRSPELCHYLSQMAGCALAPHPMTIHHGHTNLLPTEESKRRIEAIDKWHRDTVAFVLVVFVSDTCDYRGGEFQFFDGTVEEAEDILGGGQPMPLDRIRTIGPQNPGSAIFQQGWKVYHRAAAVDLASKERTSFVLSFVATNPFPLDSCYALAKTYNQIDPDFVLLPDWTRYRCWKAQRYLLHAIRKLRRRPLTLSSSSLCCEKFIADAGLIKLLGARSKLLAIVKRLPFTSDRQVLLGCMHHALTDITDISLHLEANLRLQTVDYSGSDDGVDSSGVDISGGGDGCNKDDNDDTLASAVAAVFSTCDTIKAAVADIENFQVDVSGMIYFK